jgi:hypothetical protein
MVELDGHMVTPYGGTGAVTSGTTGEEESAVSVAGSATPRAQRWIRRSGSVVGSSMLAGIRGTA